VENSAEIVETLKTLDFCEKEFLHFDKKRPLAGVKGFNSVIFP